jgi:hypothetical protein
MARRPCRAAHPRIAGSVALPDFAEPAIVVSTLISADATIAPLLPGFHR